MHLPVVVVHELLDRFTVVHVGELVAPGPEGVTDLLDLSLDRRGLSRTISINVNERETRNKFKVDKIYPRS